MKKRVTIHDIARLSGTSSATVSRVLSNSSYPVSNELRQKIRQVAEEYHYIPNMVGKQLKTHQNMTIGAIIPTISNPFYSSVMQGIEEIARKNNYHVFLCNSLQNPRIEDEYVKTLFENQVKGLIISSISNNKDQLRHLIGLGLNVVAIDQRIDIPEVRQIEFDYRQGGYMAVKHLIEQGHRSIAYVSSPLDRHSRQSIYQGYCEALEEAAIAPRDGWIQIATDEATQDDGIYEFKNGRKMTRNLLQANELPTAIFACNDMTAFGVINELDAHGMRVPDDMSVVGFDNIEFSQMVTPPLTTVRQPDYDMGRLACTMLLGMMEGEQTDENVLLLPELIERKSVKQHREYHLERYS